MSRLDTREEAVQLSRSRHGVLVVLLFFATTAYYTRPLVFRLPVTLLPGLGDYVTEASMVAWYARQTLHDPLRLFQAPFYYPYSNTVAYQQSAFFTGLLAIPGLLLTGQPLLVTNVLLVAGLVASGALGYLLAYTVTGRVVPSVLAGAVFAYFPNRMDHLGQFTYQQAVLFPLALWALYRFLLDRRWRDLLLLVTTVWAQALSSLYNGYALAFLLAGFALVFLLLRPSRLTWSLVIRATGGVLLLVALLAPFLWPYVVTHRELGFNRDVGEAEFYGMDLLSILDPGVFNRLYGGRLVSLHRAEGGMFCGFVALSLALAAPWLVRRPVSDPAPSPWVRRARWLVLALAITCVVLIAAVATWGPLPLRAGAVRLARLRNLTLAVNVLPLLALAWVALEGPRRRVEGPLRAHEWVAALTFLAILAYLLTLAPTIRVADRPVGTALFRWVYFHVPGGSAFRAPGRWSLVFALPLALLAAVATRALQDRLPGRAATLVPLGLLLGLLVEYNPSPIPWGRLPARPPVYGWLATEPDDFAVLELPIGQGDTDAWAMFWGAAHGKRIVNGGGGFPLATWNEIVEATTPFDPGAWGAAIRVIYPLRYLIVHRAKMPQNPRRIWEVMRSAPLPWLRPVRSFGDDDVYAVEGTPETGSVLRRHFSSDFARSHGTVDYTLRLDGADPEVERWVDVTLNGRALARLTSSGPGTVTLDHPLNAADRNELKFRVVYRVRPEVTWMEAYRIGGTAVHSPVDIEVISAGRDQGPLASVRVNGHETVDPPRRGYNVVALDGGDGHLLWQENFDTFRSQAESHRMAERIGGLPPGTIVAAAVKIDGGGQLTAEGVAALRSVGGQRDLQRTLWVSHALIGVKGAPPGSAVEADGPRRITLSVGHERTLAATLEAFTLR